MAHQAHNISWSVLTDHFEYGKTAAGDRDIVPQHKPNQVEALLYFARSFANNLREYAKVERRKYSPAREYKRRADSWVRSDRRPDEEIAAKEASQPRWKSKAKSVVETKKVISDYDREWWAAKQILSRPYEDDQYIENWAKGEALWTHIEDWTDRWRTRDDWVGKWTDQLKTMLLEASLTLVPLHERQLLREDDTAQWHNQMDTLFLITHHEKIPFTTEWTRECDCCCYIESGMVCLVDRALTAYIYFNMLYAMREHGSKICEKTNEANPHHLSWQPKTMLLPRARYMNTAGYKAVLHHTTIRHAHHPEVDVFQSFLWPIAGENFSDPIIQRPYPVPVPQSSWYTSFDEIFTREEVDVMNVRLEDQERLQNDALRTRGSATALKEWLCGLWKLMVNFEMLWSENHEGINWEEYVLEALELIFVSRRALNPNKFLFWSSMEEFMENNLSDLLAGEVRRTTETAEHDEGLKVIAKPPLTQREKRYRYRLEARLEARRLERLQHELQAAKRS